MIENMLIEMAPGMLFFEKLADGFRSTFIVDNRYQLFLNGFKNTILITLFAAILGIIIGNAVAITKVYCHENRKLKWLNLLMDLYITLFRGTPVVVQLMIWAFVVFSTVENEVFLAMLGLGINSGAYVAEIVRAGIMSLDPGQAEAGRSLGLSRWKTMRFIILPQALKNILPALSNEFIALLKETSIVGYIAVVDLTKAGDLVRARTFDAFTPLLFVALVYLIMVLILTSLQRQLEKKLQASDRSSKA